MDKIVDNNVEQNSIEVENDNVNERIKEIEKELSYLKKKETIPYKLAKICGKIVLGTTLTFVALFSALSIYSLLATERLSTDYNDIKAFYEEFNIHTSYDSNIENSGLNRLTVQKGKAVKFNILMEGLTEEEREQLRASVEEFNSIFQVINPSYTFEVNFSPNKFDQLDPYHVDVRFMTEQEEKENPIALAIYHSEDVAHSNNGVYNTNSEILFRRGYVNSANFSHEIMHHLGLSDAYLSKEAEGIPSIMQSGEKHIRTNDIGLISGKYGVYSTEENKNTLAKFIANYEQSQPWYSEESQNKNGIQIEIEFE